MQHLDEGTIHAWLDDQLPPDEAKAVEAHVAECRQCADAVAEARGLIAASSRILMSLDGVPRDVVPVPAESRMDPQQTADAPVVVAPLAPQRAHQRAHQRAQRRWLSGPSLAAAATILVAAGTFAVMRTGNRDLGPAAESVTTSAPASGPMATDTVAASVARRSPAPVPVVAPPAAPARQALGSAIATVQPQGAAAGQKATDAKAENAPARPRMLAEPLEQRRLSAKTAAESRENALADRAEVSRQVVPQQQAQFAPRDELKKVPATDSLLARAKPNLDSTAGARRADAANASSTTGVVRGRVTDANGTGLSNAMVNVVGTATGVPTTSTGEFTLGGLEPGTRQLRVVRLGYQPTTRDVTVVAGQAATAEIVLAPAQVALNEAVVTGSSVAVPSSPSSARRRASASGIEPAPGAPVTAAQSNAVGCYELGITPTGAQTRTGFRQVPRRIALDSEIVPANADGVWYRARDLSRVGTLPNGLWRPAGPDAVELEWSYGTRTDRVRLSGPAGSMMRGTIEEIDRATATGDAGSVVAVRRPCDG